MSFRLVVVPKRGDGSRFVGVPKCFPKCFPKCYQVLHHYLTRELTNANPIFKNLLVRILISHTL